jgi:hypothetical protein
MDGIVPHFCDNPDMWYEKSRNSRFSDGGCSALLAIIMISTCRKIEAWIVLPDLRSLFIHVRLLNSLFQFTLLFHAKDLLATTFNTTREAFSVDSVILRLSACNVCHALLYKC